MQPGRTTNTGGGTMEVKAAAPRCQLLLILLVSAVMLLPETNGSLLLVQRTITRTIVLQETIGKAQERCPDLQHESTCSLTRINVCWKLQGKFSDLEQVCALTSLQALYSDAITDLLLGPRKEKPYLAT
ncbi:hypothetical protein STEG23_034596 [Scotinomys teguina]